jgi:hypothetical protein
MRHLLIIIILGAWSVAAEAQTMDASAVVIANGIGQNTISAKELRSIMRGEGDSFWDNNTPVTVVLHATTNADCAKSALFLVNVARPSTLQRHWLSLVFQGRARPPIFQNDDARIIEFVRNTPGAIAIVYSGQVPTELQVAIER